MQVQVQVLRPVKRGGDIVPAGTTIEVSRDEAARFPELYKPTEALAAERLRATAQPAEEAAARLTDHMAMRRALAAEEAEAQRARARLLGEQAEQAARIAAEAARQAGMAPAAPAEPAAAAAPAAPPAEVTELPPHKRGRTRSE